MLRFLGLPTDSALYRAATTIPPWLCRDHAAVPQPHWRVSVPDTLEDYYAPEFTAIDRAGIASVRCTRVGSPFVIARLNALSSASVCGSFTRPAQSSGHLTGHSLRYEG